MVHHLRQGLQGSLDDKNAGEQKTYNSRDSLVVTHPTTNRPACGLSTAERTGSPVFHTLWSYVLRTKITEYDKGYDAGGPAPFPNILFGYQWERCKTHRPNVTDVVAATEI
jgi:hypothetical protein